MILGGESRCFGGLKWGFCCQLLSDFWKLTTVGRFGRKKKHRKYKGFLCFEFKSCFSKIQYLVRRRSRVQVPSSAPFKFKMVFYVKIFNNQQKRSVLNSSFFSVLFFEKLPKTPLFYLLSYFNVKFS